MQHLGGVFSLGIADAAWHYPRPQRECKKDTTQGRHFGPGVSNRFEAAEAASNDVGLDKPEGRPRSASAVGSAGLILTHHGLHSSFEQERRNLHRACVRLLG
jgi:hypothetical protein